MKATYVEVGIMNIDEHLVTIGGGFLSGALIGFALKKVLKILAIVVAYLLLDWPIFSTNK